tara:strand:- start:118 stop:312 length:195 start_codon:yes stop_codon:yes gene_type:complete
MFENYDSKFEKKVEDAERKHREDDARMKYGKNFKDFMSNDEDRLKPGEVRRYDKRKKKWVSNKK